MEILIAFTFLLLIALGILISELFFWRRLAKERKAQLDTLVREWERFKIMLPMDLRSQVDKAILNSWCSKPAITGGTP